MKQYEGDWKEESSSEEEDGHEKISFAVRLVQEENRRNL